MQSRPYPNLLLTLLSGLALGAAGSAWWFRPASRPTPSTQAAGIVTTDRVSPLILPPRLDESEASEAIDAYLKLPPLGPTASATEIAERAARLRALLTILPTSSFDRLLSALATREGHAEATLRRTAFHVWTERDAPAAARWALALVPGSGTSAEARASYLTDAILLWAESDFDAAYAWVLASPEEISFQTIRPRLLAKIAATDPHRALTLIGDGSGPLVVAAQEAVFAVWSEHDPAAAIQALGAAVFDVTGNMWKYRHTLVRWVKSDARAALAWMSSGATPTDIFNPSPSDTVVMAIFPGPLSHDSYDSAAAFALVSAVAERSDLPDQFQRLGHMLGLWNKNDPGAVRSWLNAHPDHPLRLDLVEKIVSYGRPDQATDNLALATSLPMGQKRDTLVAKTVGQWAEQDHDAALAWLRAHEDDSAFDAASAQVEMAIVKKLAATDLAAALTRWESLPAGEDKGKAAFALSNALAEKDPAAASRWFAERISMVPANHSAESWLRQFVASWAQRDGEAALRWGESLPDPKTRREALLAFVDRYTSTQASETYDRADQAALIAKIQDPALRSDILSQHVAQWLRADYRAARAWIESNKMLPPKQVERLLDNANPAYRR